MLEYFRKVEVIYFINYVSRSPVKSHLNLNDDSKSLKFKWKLTGTYLNRYKVYYSFQ